MSIVVDSSVVPSWCFEDERTTATVALLTQVTEVGAAAPVLWPLEVLNGLAMAERRGRLEAARRHQLAGFLRELPITIDYESASQAWTDTATLAERCRLTLYDAAFLELAQRLGLPLATLDRDLRSAATAVGVKLLGIAE